MVVLGPKDQQGTRDFGQVTAYLRPHLAHGGHACHRCPVVAVLAHPGTRNIGLDGPHGGDKPTKVLGQSRARVHADNSGVDQGQPRNIRLGFRQAKSQCPAHREPTDHHRTTLASQQLKLAFDAFVPVHPGCLRQLAPRCSMPGKPWQANSVTSLGKVVCPGLQCCWRTGESMAQQHPNFAASYCQRLMGGEYVHAIILSPLFQKPQHFSEGAYSQVDIPVTYSVLDAGTVSGRFGPVTQPRCRVASHRQARASAPSSPAGFPDPLRVSYP